MDGYMDTLDYSEARKLREFMTPEERVLVDQLLWSPAQAVQRYQQDPVAFAHEVLNMELTPYQARTLRDLIEHRRVCFRGPHGSGKSTVGSAAVLWFIGVWEECKIITTASAWRQLTNFFWPEIHKWSNKASWWKVGLNVRPGKELMKEKLEINANRFAVAAASNDPVKMEGAHSANILYLFDESKGIIPETWDAAEGALGTHNAYALALSTPGDSVGRFYDINTKREKYSAWRVVAVTDEEVIAAGRMDVKWREDKKREWGEDSVMYKRRVQGLFAEDHGESLIKMSEVEAAQEKWHALMERVDQLIAEGVARQVAMDQVWGDLMTISIDPAGKGSNKTGYAYRFMPGIMSVRQSDEEDTMITADLLATELEAGTAMAHIDTNGLGVGIYDRIRQLHRQKKLRAKDTEIPAMAINVSNATRQRDRTGELTFVRLRDYLWWNLRELLKAGEIALPPNETLMEDLVAYRWSMTQNGKIQIESKDEVKKRIGRSTDMGDAVMMAFAPPAPRVRLMFDFI